MPDGLIHSMFHRRLLLLLGLTLVGAALLSGQLFRLTVVQGADLLREAERALVVQRWVETTRGRILDRRGRVLAVDRPSFDVAADYRVITGSWAYSQAAAEARAAHRDRWAELSAPDRDALIRRRLPGWLDRLESMWDAFARTADIDRAELERRKSEVTRQVQRMASTIWERRRVAREAELNRDREQLIEVDLAAVARPIREQVGAHVLLRDVDDETAFAFRRLAETYPGIKVRDSGTRAYPFSEVAVGVDRSTFPSPLRTDGVAPVTVEGVATHLLGWMRDGVHEEDIEARRARFGESKQEDRGHYRPGDSVGVAGLEAAHEHTLRGLRGRIARRLDTGDEEVTEPEPGQDLELTIDIMLQTRVQALLDPALGLAVVQEWHGNPELDEGVSLAGAAVVLDVETGEILAMASGPTFTREDLQAHPERVFDDPIRAPWVNRAVGRPYAPGSIVKPLTLVRAVDAGAHRLDMHIECRGHFLPGRPDIYRCWIYRPRFGMTTHTAQVDGALGAREAIARSCNIYFYTLGRALGVEGMTAMYRALGVGEAHDLGLPDASPGFLGHLDGAPLYLNDAIMMAIGQGPVSWTPLHAASAYAALAQRGVRRPPALVRAGGDEVVVDAEGPVDLEFDDAAVEAALDGLWRGVNESYGTGNHITLPGGQEPIFNVPGVRILGKTGTAQAAPTIGEDPDGDGPAEAPVRRNDHAWTVVLAGPEGKRPRYAVAVVVEHGGSGGRVAGPIANQVVHALVDEGYLPEASP